LTPEEELTYYKKAYKREKLARKETERILESKAEELYNVNSKLLSLNINLEENLLERTEQIKEAEKEFSNLVESANVMIYKTDINGHLTFINPTGEKTSGYSSDELIGQPFSDLVRKNERKQMVLFYKNQFKNNIESTYYEYPIITKSGDRVWIGQNVQLIVKDDSSIGFWAVARNITKRVKSDNELKQSNDKYKKLFEGAFDGVIRLDAKRCFIEWNSKMETLLGYSAKELKGMHITEVLHEEDLEKSMAYLERLKNNGFYSNYIGRIKSKSGKLIDIEVNSTATFEDGIMTGSIDSVRDITERITLEKAIVRSEEKYRGIIENLEFGLLEVNLQGRIQKAYPSFCKLTGYSKEELIGTDPYNILHPDFISVLEEKTKDREKGISNVYEVKIKQKSGDYKWVIISGAPFYDELGKLQGSIGVHLDISPQKKMESDLIKANKEAKASSKAKELFLANMSHEIRTPLNAVFGLSNLLKNTDLNDDQIEYVKNINNSAQSLLLLVNDILDISKIESGKLEANNTKFNLRKTLSTILSSTSFLADEKQLNLNFEIDNRLDNNYLGDELKICQVLINLINNAIKFTSHGEIILKLDKISDIGSAHKIKFSVKDTGKGIAKEAMQLIFEDFSQEDNTISKQYGGTGLGLSISKKLVRILGGKLGVHSTVGVGTNFSFEIILTCIDESILQKEESTLPNLDWKSVKILTVEDNQVNQFVIESTIKTWNGHTDIANNGEEALKLITENEYHIILMDMQMPIMDGISATKYIRQKMKSTIPIIAFTANALKKEKERCIAIGMNDYITKPFQEELLKSKITNLIIEHYPQEFNLTDNIQLKKIESLFNTSRLTELSRGNESFIKKILIIFYEDGKTQLKQIQNSKNSEEIAKLAHKIKPSIDYLSNDTMKTLVRRIEQQEFIKTPKLLNQFITQLDQLITLAETKSKTYN
jgi:PAS domain S-box-containing protein